jgi:hypothetical protein
MKKLNIFIDVKIMQVLKTYSCTQPNLDRIGCPIRSSINILDTGSSIYVMK